MGKKFEIAIVGGGIGGLCLGIGLSKYSHISFTIYESRPNFREIGAGVGFNTNGHRAMSLLSPAVWEKYQENANFSGTPEKKGFWFSYEVGEKGVNEGKRIVETVMPEGMEQSTTHRTDLLAALVSLLPASCARFGKRLVDVKENDGSGRVTAFFADGTIVEVDAVIGCDGIKSACRGFVFGKASELSRPVFTGKVAYRGLVPMNKALAALGEEKAKNRQMYIGHHRHMLTFGVAKGTLMNVVAYHGTGSDTWDGEWVRPVTRDDFQRDFAGWGSAVSKIISLIEKPDIWAIYDHPKVHTFHKGHLCLLGDAAHSTSPHLGMGGGMAVEDAYILSGLLSKCHSPSDLGAVFKAYDFARVERTCRIVAASREHGKLADMEGEGVGEDLEMMAEQLGWENRAWLWDFHPEESLHQALERYEEERKK